MSVETAGAQSFSGTGYDLVATFDSLHDMGDPLGAARHIRAALAADGTWMVVEPRAGDTVADNLNPVGRAYYGFSAFLCVPNARSQPGGYSLGARRGGRDPADRDRRRVHPFRRVAADAAEQHRRDPTVGKGHASTGAGHSSVPSSATACASVRGVRAAAGAATGPSGRRWCS